MRRSAIAGTAALCVVVLAAGTCAAQKWWKPYTPPCTERENVFAFTQKPVAKLVGKDKYEIVFAVKGYCDVTVGIIDGKGKVVRHLGSGVLGKNAPPPFQKNSLKQTLYWGGKDDLDVYVKEPGKLKVRVMLGLKPEFDKLLGPTSPKALPGYVWGIAADEAGVYVFSKGASITVRKFDHDGNYIETLFPPPAGMPPEKLGGMGYVEYEPGKRAPCGPDFGEYNSWGRFMPWGADAGLFSCQPVVADGRIYFLGLGGSAGKSKRSFALMLHWIFTDGRTDSAGIRGQYMGDFEKSRKAFMFLAAPATGKTVYASGVDNGARFVRSKPVVLRARRGDIKPRDVFVGHMIRVGSDNAHLQNPGGIACDAQGRVYVTDTHNNRVQIFSAGGRHLKTLKVDRPRLVQVHQKTGAVYVAHAVSRGRSSSRLTKYKAFPDLSVECHADNLDFSVMALDSWSRKPRLWISMNPVGARIVNYNDELTISRSVHVLEEDEGTFRAVLDFDKEARKAAGGNYHDRWQGGLFDEVVCDPTREQVYYDKMRRFDLVTGKYLGPVPGVSKRQSGVTRLRGVTDDMAFDKYGFLHTVVPANLDPPRSSGLGRLHPSRTEEVTVRNHPMTRLAEVPYDHGDESKPWVGRIPLYRTDHHGWSWGLGVNMRGDIAVVQDIEFAPTRPEETYRRIHRRTGGVGGGTSTYAKFLRSMQNRQKQGEQFFVVRRRPGVDPQGGAIFTFDRTGEVRAEPAVVTGGKTLGVDIDEDGDLYFYNQCGRAINGKPFLRGRGGWYGSDRRFTPQTAVYVKSGPKDVMFQWEKSKVPMNPMPNRPADMMPSGGSSSSRVWAKGAKWLYAGASPFPMTWCECPQLRGHLDWYKRSFVPELYRHSIGVLDTNGNLILHIGQYGNWDNGFGPKGRAPVGGDGVAVTYARFVSGTDNYLVFGDRGERLVVLKLNYHAEETAPVKDGRE